MRLLNLDYLRGMAAAGIMIYHFQAWSFGNFTAESVWGRIGIYGVSIFYVLSGLTLFHVYHRSLKFDVEGLRKFYVRRFLRIYPLLWVVTIVTIVFMMRLPSIEKLVLNLTGLFGFIKWDGYIGTGVWSIGNELVFYVFFPFFILFSREYKILFASVSILLFAIFLYFAFIVITPHQTISEQWSDYINPLNQVFLFWSGFFIGRTFESASFSKPITYGLIIVGVLLFSFYPAEGDRVTLIYGTARIVFTLACVLVCLGVYKINLDFPGFLSKPLSMLGEASYSVYLLHPLVYKVCDKGLEFVVPGLNDWVKIVAAVAATFVLSYLTYEKFEKYFMGLGKSKLDLNKLS